MAAREHFDGRDRQEASEVFDVANKDYMETNYRKFYKLTPKPPTVDQVAVALAKVKPGLGQNFRQFPGTVDEKAVRAWASNDYHRALTKVLLQDEEDQVHAWILFARAICTYLTNPAHAPKRDLTTYRGSKASEEMASKCQVGLRFRLPMFVATSLKKEKAEAFKRTYLIEFKIRKGCLNACPISHLSGFDEEEVLLPAYTPVCVLSADHDAKHLVYEVLDGFVESASEKESGDFNPSIQCC